MHCTRRLGAPEPITGLASFAETVGAGLRRRLPGLEPTGSIHPDVAALIRSVATYGASNEVSGATAAFSVPSGE